MDKEIFVILLQELPIKSSRFIEKGEKLLIWLSMTTGYSNRSLQERYQHSGETISRIIRDVTNAILSVKDRYVVDPNLSIPHEISKAPMKFFPYFKNCIGALDGTHIQAVIPEKESKPFRNRKGYLSQNVLAVVNFDLTFSYILAGWEGSAHDSRVLDDAIDKGLYLPDGKYYLGDAGYGLKHYCLTPYRGTRYHLKEWANGNQKPRNKEELFNLRHSSLRNAVERVFGILKQRFPVLKNMVPYPYQVQVQLVITIMTIHNFIRLKQKELSIDEYIVVEIIENMNTTAIETTEPVISDDSKASSWRDSIAQEMYNDYVRYIGDRG